METVPSPVFFLALRHGDTVTVRKMLSTAGAQSWIDCQDSFGATPLLVAAANGHESVTKQLIEAANGRPLHVFRVFNTSHVETIFFCNFFSYLIFSGFHDWYHESQGL